VSLIQIFSISGLFIALQTNASVIYNAIGKPRYMSMISLFNILFLFIPALYFLIQLHGVLGIAEAYLISSVLIWPINYSIIKRLINIKWKSILLVIWRPIFSGLIMYFFIVEYTQILNESHPIENQVLKLFIMVLSGAFVYIVTDILLWSASRFPDGAEKFIFKKLKQS
jgi:O-antigen/teichoic acid export membrane protein